MPKQWITIPSILGGESPAQTLAAEGQYLAGIGIDPEMPMTDAVGDRVASAVIRPTAYEKFSSTLLTGTPLWLLTSPKNSLVYAYQSDGKLTSYSSSLGSETSVGTPTSGAGNGGAYYNNYLYLATPTNISRYGPLNGSPSLTNTVWTGATLGTQTALTDTTYPTMRGSIKLPNHVMHVHGDNKLYFSDFINGQGQIHYIKTKKVTDEGDTNDGSTYGALDLPFGYMPTAIESIGTDLIVAAIQTSNGSIKQGSARLFLWDTFSDSFYQEVPVEDTLVTAIKNINGTLFVWSGEITSGTDVSNGYRISIYNGQGLTQVYLSETGTPPFPGAVEATGNRMLWGGFEQLRTTTAASPDYYGVVKSIGAKKGTLPGGVHTIAKMSVAATAADGFVTALKNTQVASLGAPKLVLGWRNASAVGLDKLSTTYGTSVFRTHWIPVGKRFRIVEIRMNTVQAVAANMTVTPKVFVDNYRTSFTSGMRVINSTNYANSDTVIRFQPDINGRNNMMFELVFSGTALVCIHPQISILVEVLND